MGLQPEQGQVVNLEYAPELKELGQDVWVDNAPG